MIVNKGSEKIPRIKVDQSGQSNLYNPSFLYIDKHTKSWVFQGSIVQVTTEYFTNYIFNGMGYLEIF